MKTQHTPGPWQSFNGGAVVGTVEDRDGSTYVADIRHRANGESAANARLIAAAPDMLAALVSALSVLDAEAEARGAEDSADYYGGSAAAAAASVRVAIAKVRGEAA